MVSRHWLEKTPGMFTVNRSGIQLGTRTVGEAYHVTWESPDEECSVASFWLGEKQSPAEAHLRATALADELNGRSVGASRG